MTIDSEGIERLKTYWKSIQDPFGLDAIMDPEDRMMNWVSPYTHYRVSEEIKRMGLDPLADETYDLLESGLTRTKYFQSAAYNAIAHWIKNYHEASAYNEWKTAAYTYYGLEELLRSHENIRALAAVAGLPEGASPMITAQFALICEQIDSGVIKSEYMKAANFHARYSMHVAGRRYERLQETLRSKRPSYEKHGENGLEYLLTKADDILTAIDKAENFYTPCQIPYEHSEQGPDGRMKRETRAIPYTREHALKIAEDCAILMCKSDLDFLAANRQHHPEDNHDDRIDYREMLGYLDKARFDLDSEDTYLRIGTTKREFLTNYHRQAKAHGIKGLSGRSDRKKTPAGRFKLTP
ncbi:MAG: hypothetical protein EBQ96_08890 [Proteobacteria bacterium]|nr:hypothetical protein [Pseudomonadota bacterium]